MTEYELLAKTYAMSKSGYMKLKTYPMIGTIIPYFEKSSTFALEKAGLPEFETLESTYITPTLTKLDSSYVNPAATKTVEYAESVKAKCAKTADGLGSRPEDAKQKFSQAKAKAAQVVESTKTTVQSYVDEAKDVALSAKAKVSSIFDTGATTADVEGGDSAE
mmetsp:Transcript_22083/g.28594  ORF Transcript_22083/g.28594 Transcript_22083/m.28594 type:complete len:163 (-) Transcript_22083:280-768(-)|eukprot:CAMPEP_0197295334 /NCGR_PEP_ID=MMETSP0890-20130614/35229_1 /TAXON_ID=44058 ORGANISM="Aureoumbra lagunensis, Strain CCMP1510" /NCGR_SAMPLE_ID=MMETSP0890 /ASSEMBLY_ACC=CAM_ASM_000533 /LENGTH=162 /DNA_ID=CAMNT_0042771251 /DNA_START=75 /DNA_END=563 /DNA_ORIENTATION=-